MGRSGRLNVHDISPFLDAAERRNVHANDGSESHDCDAQRKAKGHAAKWSVPLSAMLGVW